MKKKIFSGLLSLAMMFDCLAMSDVAFEAKAYETCGGYWYIVLEDGTAEIIKYVGREEEVVIPETLNGYTVTVIGTTTGSVTIGAFEAQCDIYSVVIPDTVISIKENAFSECYYLADITIPSSVTNIHSTAFDYTMWINNKLAEDPMVIINDILVCSSCTGEVIIPNEVKAIAEEAFSYNTELTSVVIPDGITEIGLNAFWGCDNLKSITIPKSVTKMDRLGLEPHYSDKVLIRCYSNSVAHQHAINNDFDYELLDPELQGTIYYQQKSDNSAIRFIADVSIEDVENATSGNIKIVANSDEYNRKVKTAYRSIIVNGEKMEAPEGKYYIITPAIMINDDDGDVISAEFTLDACSGSIKREITI